MDGYCLIQLHTQAQEIWAEVTDTNLTSLHIDLKCSFPTVLNKEKKSLEGNLESGLVGSPGNLHLCRYWKNKP